jgi:hypothetical protein
MPNNKMLNDKMPNNKMPNDKMPNVAERQTPNAELYNIEP